ncbi:MAG: hypothetical protein WC528_05530 [Patescibacteria group bacterium]
MLSMIRRKKSFNVGRKSRDTAENQTCPFFSGRDFSKRSVAPFYATNNPPLDKTRLI